MGTAHTGWYIPVRTLIGTRTTCYRAIPSIGVVSALLPPKSANNNRFRPSPAAVGWQRSISTVSNRFRAIDVREKHTIGAEGGASDDGQLLAGVDVLEDGLVEPGQMLVPFLEHCLDPVPRKPERHTALVLETPRGMEKDTVEIKARSEEIRNP
ncbi:hypothetical protein GW17_00047192 [Ensete ventricosum]|nr:hypothetical protein GW17_00047192 [Ensete ventricosum]